MERQTYETAGEDGAEHDAQGDINGGDDLTWPTIINPSNIIHARKN